MIDQETVREFVASLLLRLQYRDADCVQAGVGEAGIGLANGLPRLRA